MSATTEASAREPLGQVLRDMRGFVVIWIGQLVSGLGSGLTGFALPVWIYQQTGSAEQFGLLFFAATIPGVLLAPFAGPLVDRWNRRAVLIASDAAAAAMTLVIAALVFSGRFEFWHLFVVSLVGSAVGTFQDPAFTASMRMLVPQRHFTRAAGLLQTSGAVNAFLTPLIAGALVTLIGLGGVLLIDLATFLVAMGTLVAARIPEPPRRPGPRRSLLADAREGWDYIRARPGLLYLLMYFPVINLGTGMINPLFQPMVLSFTTPAALGLMLSLSSVGMIVGGLALSTWGGPRRRVRGMVVGQVFITAFIVLMGLRPSVWLVGAAMFLNLMLVPTAQACSQSIWLSKTPPDMTGRVFAMRRMLSLCTVPIAALAAGPLAERVFNPLLMPGGALADSLGPVFGVGPGRGIGLLMAVVAAFTLVMTVLLYLNPRIRHLEDEVPDAAPESPAHPAPAAAPAPRPAAAGA